MNNGNEDTVEKLDARIKFSQKLLELFEQAICKNKNLDLTFGQWIMKTIYPEIDQTHPTYYHKDIQAMMSIDGPDNVRTWLQINIKNGLLQIVNL